jgi:hypothetical protein
VGQIFKALAVIENDLQFKRFHTVQPFPSYHGRIHVNSYTINAVIMESIRI